MATPVADVEVDAADFVQAGSLPAPVAVPGVRTAHRTIATSTIPVAADLAVFEALQR